MEIKYDLFTYWRQYSLVLFIFYAMLISAADLFSELQNKAHSDAQQRKQV